MAKIDLQPVEPEEAIEYFKRRGFAISFDWRDVWQEEHARAFTVAKVASLDVLTDIQVALSGAIKEGLTPRQFAKELEPVLRRKGWWGKGEVVDPKTGEITTAQLGSPARLRTIFDTNLHQAMAAGRWERIERLKEQRPFLRYVTIDDSRRREQHADWHGTVLPVGDPWWDTHYPMNGWGCRCYVVQLSAAEVKRRGYKVSKPPKVKTRKVRNRKTGEVVETPVGVDPGFGYNVGKAGQAAIGDLMVEKLDRAPADVARAMVDQLTASEHFERFHAGAVPGRHAVAAAPDRLATAMKAAGRTVVVEASTIATLRAGKALADVGAWRLVNRAIAEGRIAGAGKRRRVRLEADGRTVDVEIERDADRRLVVRRITES